MRVLLSGRPRRRRDEHGVVAIVCALMSVVLLLLAGFVADFGAAYVSKRQLQTAVDAAALAAASVYADYPGDCETLLANAEARGKAEAKADAYRALNHPGAVGDPIEVSCSDDALQVEAPARAATRSLFSGLAGTPSKIWVNRTATAALEVSQKAGTGFRPMAICSGDLPDGGAITGHVVRINAPGNGGTPPNYCPSAAAPGNWWTVDCPEERLGMTSQLEAQIRYGCSDPVSIIDGQSGLVGEPLALVLTGSCEDVVLHDENCLSGDPGQLDAGHIENSWRYLIDLAKAVVLPVFYVCDPASCIDTTPGTGTNAVFPVHKLATMQMCGYHFGKSVTYQPDTSSECVTGNVNHYDVRADNSEDNYLLAVYKTVQVSGSNRPGGCRFGDLSCDGGTRGVRIVR